MEDGALRPRAVARSDLNHEGGLLHRGVLAAGELLEQVLVLEQAGVDDGAEVLGAGLVSGALDGLGDLGDAHGLALEDLVEGVGERALVGGARAAAAAAYERGDEPAGRGDL